MADWIFLDHHTKSPPSLSMTEALRNESITHWLFGDEGSDRLKTDVLELLGAKKGELLLSSSCAQSHFQVLLSHYITSIRETGRTHILTPETEVRSIVEGIKSLEKFDVQMRRLAVNHHGQVTRASVVEAVRARSSLLTLSWTDPLSGVVHPISDLVEVCREHDIEVHLDISTALGKLYLPFADLEIDYLTFEGRLLNCPIPLGATIVKEGKKVLPIGYAAPPYPYSYFSCLKRGMALALEKMDHYAMEVSRLRDFFEQALASMGGKLFFQQVERLPNTIVVAFEGIHGEHLLFYLRRQGLIATTGEGRLCELLVRCGVKKRTALCAIAFALSDTTELQEIERAIEMMQESLSTLAKYAEKIDA